MNSELSWRKSSFSGGSGGNCVEVADNGGHVLVRDTRAHGHGPVHRYTPAQWQTLITIIKTQKD
jgi:hypothetical protein